MDEIRRETAAERRQKKLEDKIDQLAELRGIDSDEIKGYVYRESANGIREALPPVEMILDDHELGIMYGPGKYHVIYKIETDDDAGSVRRSVYYHIGWDYAELYRENCRMTGRRCNLDRWESEEKTKGFSLANIAANLDESKIKAYLALLVGVKGLLGGNEGGTNAAMLEMMKAMIARPVTPTNGLNDTIMQTLLTRAIDPPKQSNPLEDMGKQLTLFKDLKEVIDPSEKDDGGRMGFVEKLLDKGLENLPALLEMMNGNARAAGETFRAEQSKPAAALLESPKNQAIAFARIRKAHGLEVAKEFARGYGMSPEVIEKYTQATNPKQISPVVSPIVTPGPVVNGNHKVVSSNGFKSF